ncbi:uncharacterized protein LOC131456838 isoform X1 [Solea solea]|uniref:uncharacterized protein LOC131456838 isoform X1 n=1 Tax=Solea solea TaxID=90069 RepID=UPI0027297730|nr:uncharacterized protein LOC131456838 isoform X1 [Solea solea]
MKMTKPALLVLYLILGEIAGMTNMSPSMHQERHLISTRVGETITVECVLHHSLITRFYWYKQSPGQEPRLMCTYYKYQGNKILHNEFEKSPRFTVETGNTKFHMTIADVRVSDSATYYCASSFTATIQFADGIIVNVDGSGLKAQALVRQSPVTLSCPVHKGPSDGQHSVYWFNSEEAHLGLIYTCENNSDRCERNLRTQTHTCVYKLPMKSLNRSHTGTHYCAVASCGHVEFGNGSNLDFKGLSDQVNSVVSVHFLSGAVALCNILSVLLAFCMWGIKRKRSCICEGSAARFTGPFSSSAECYQNEDRFHDTVTQTEKKLNSGRRQKNNTWSQCVYFSVKQ